jgi:hypothetical protein
MSYRIAGIDVHKRMLAVVASDVEVDGEYQFERRSRITGYIRLCADDFPGLGRSFANIPCIKSTAQGNELIYDLCSKNLNLFSIGPRLVQPSGLVSHGSRAA